MKGFLRKNIYFYVRMIFDDYFRLPFMEFSTVRLCTDFIVFTAESKL